MILKNESHFANQNSVPITTYHTWAKTCQYSTGQTVAEMYEY